MDRILKYAFELAQQRPRKRLTAATKSNGMAISMPYWDERVAEMARQYPDIARDKQHIDILCARFVLNPERFDVVVASNLFGDILSDLGPACTGTIGIAPSANLNPERNFPSLFEPVHGSAPDIFGKNIANPIAMIWSGAMMLDFPATAMPVTAGRMTASCRRSSASSPTGRARRTCAAMPPPSKSAGDRRPAATLSITDFPVRGALSRPAFARPFFRFDRRRKSAENHRRKHAIPRPRSQQIVYILCFILLQMPQLWPSCNLCTLENVNEE